MKDQDLGVIILKFFYLDLQIKDILMIVYIVLLYKVEY